MTVGATPRDELQRLAALPDRRGQVYANLQALVPRRMAEVRTGMPALSRRASGNALDHLLPENGSHVARALVGTEGSCAVALGATLRLVPAPSARVLVVLGYPDSAAAGDAVPGLPAHAPLTVEGLGRELIAAWTAHHSTRVQPPDGQAWLMVEVGGIDTERLESGCCGLAGGFGFERGHYDVSQACAERALCPAVRDAQPDTLLLADGFSGRPQTEYGTDRHAQHLAEVLPDTRP